MWLFFTLIFGMLPIIFLCISALFSEYGLTFGLHSLSKEMFFLTIILCADILKTLYDTDDEQIPNKSLLYGLSIVILVISSVLYGCVLLSSGEHINPSVYLTSLVFCIFSIILGFATQVIISQKQDNYIEKNESEKS